MYNDTTSDMVNQICSIVWSQKKSVTIAIMDVLKHHAWLCTYIVAFCIGIQHIIVYWWTTVKEDVAKKIWGHIYIYNYSLFDGDIPTIISFF